jgi:hypothetical protein
MMSQSGEHRRWCRECAAQYMGKKTLLNLCPGCERRRASTFAGWVIGSRVYPPRQVPLVQLSIDEFLDESELFPEGV